MKAFSKKSTPTKGEKRGPKSSTNHQAAQEPPIVKLIATSKREASHYNEALKFALKVANPRDNSIQTVHLNLADTLVFNAKQDDAFKRLWLRGELALLVAFPCNWQTLSLKALNALLDIDMDEDEDAEDWPDMSVEERFDLIYENSLKVHFDNSPSKAAKATTPVKAPKQIPTEKKKTAPSPVKVNVTKRKRGDR